MKAILHVDVEYDLPDLEAAELEASFVDMIQRLAEDTHAVRIDAKFDDRVILDLDRRPAIVVTDGAQP